MAPSYALPTLAYAPLLPKAFASPRLGPSRPPLLPPSRPHLHANDDRQLRVQVRQARAHRVH
eukprot:352868-Chlamydomonas_euryale.AAC.2